jgi:hypothetical protein
MSIKLILTIPLLLVSNWINGMALAAPTKGTCPSDLMNATQYSSSSRTGAELRIVVALKLCHASSTAP